MSKSSAVQISDPVQYLLEVILANSLAKGSRIDNIIEELSS